MPERSSLLLTHGGAGSDPAHKDGTDAAAEAGLTALQRGGTALEAVVAAVTVLEDDERFNAGTGSNLRLDGATIELDAAVMVDDGRLGAVAALRDARNPILVARRVMDTEHVLLAGEGATRFARQHGFERAGPTTAKARERHSKVRAFLAGQRDKAPYGRWSRDGIGVHWNFPEPLAALLRERDTVGAVCFDGQRHAAALSTGGTPLALLGRVGDSPLPGCGLFAGPLGAVACTGHGEAITRRVLAHTVYHWLMAGFEANAAVERALEGSDADDLGLLVVTPDGGAAGANRSMAWSLVGGT